MNGQMQMHKNRISSSRRYNLLRTLVIMSVKNIWFKKFRSFLTVMGVVIGIGSVFLLLSFGLGLQHLVQQQIIGSTSINTIDVTSTSQAIVLNEDSISRFRAVANVNSASGEFTQAGKLTLKGASADVVTYGIDKTTQQLLDLKLSNGKLLDTSSSSNLILSSGLLQAAGIKDTGSMIGQQVKLVVPLGGKNEVDSTFKIVGVVDSSSGSAVYIPKSVISRAGGTKFALIKVVVGDRKDIPGVRTKIESYGYTTASPVDTLDQINQVFHFFNLILVGFGSIGMIIAILGMLNTLTVSLLERTQEIALMMALGGRPKDMNKLFIFEAVILSVTGGTVGIIGAVILGRGVSYVLNQLAASRGVTQHFSIIATPPILVIGTLLFMVLVGTVVAFVPAKRASHIDPITALRHE